MCRRREGEGRASAEVTHGATHLIDLTFSAPWAHHTSQVLKMDEGREEGGSDSSAGEEEEEGGGEGEEDIHDLDLRVAVDVQAMYKASSLPVTRSDTLLLKYVLATSLYPRCERSMDATIRMRQLAYHATPHR